ncbi:MAG TPA: Rrf2 family transcriptional regulator [Candidatus Brocadiia bacterium]|nr:Rrf2 family transcriptional regulator [Candidatus Brocadiia bacterium]
MLALSTKGRYATRILIFMARRNKAMRKQDIAEAEGISADYVEQLLIKLKSANLVKSHRGAKGGFSLARSPEKITVADVLAATEGTINLAPCVSEDCSRAGQCVTRKLWHKAGDQLRQTFAGVTIAGLAQEAEESQRSGELVYDI